MYWRIGSTGRNEPWSVVGSIAIWISPYGAMLLRPQHHRNIYAPTTLFLDHSYSTPHADWMVTLIWPFSLRRYIRGKEEPWLLYKLRIVTKNKQPRGQAASERLDTFHNCEGINHYTMKYTEQQWNAVLSQKSFS